MYKHSIGNETFKDKNNIFILCELKYVFQVSSSH